MFSVFTFVLRDFLHQLVVLGLLPLQVVFDHGLPDDSRSLVLTRHLDRGTNIKALRLFITVKLLLFDTKNRFSR